MTKPVSSAGHAVADACAYALPHGIFFYLLYFIWGPRGASFHLWKRRRALELGRNWWDCDRYMAWEEVGLYCHWGDDGSG